MPGQNQGGGGPWGGGGNGGGQGPWNRGPGGGGIEPPNVEELLRKGRERMRGMVPGGRGNWRIAALVAVGLVGLWFASGFYRVLPDQQGIVLTFGRWSNQNAPAQPGLNWHWPAPIQPALTPSVTRDNRIEVGFLSRPDNGRGPGGTDLAEEGLMLTADQNVLTIQFVVLWRIKNAGEFLFTSRDPDALIKVAAESVMRETIGRTPIQAALTEGRGKIQTDTQAALQGLLDRYGIGVEIKEIQLLGVDPPAPVVDAFNDVQRARLDQDRLRNEAEAYANDIVPRARGDSERLFQESQAYAQEVVSKAEGDAKRFTAVYEAYAASKDVTVQRLYLDTMEQVLRNANKVIVDKGAGGSGVVPYLPLPELKPALPQSEKQ